MKARVGDTGGGKTRHGGRQDKTGKQQEGRSWEEEMLGIEHEGRARSKQGGKSKRSFS